MRARQVVALVFSAQAVNALLEANQTTNTSTTTSTTSTVTTITTTSKTTTGMFSSTTAGVTGPPAFGTSSIASSLWTNTSTSTTTSSKSTSSTADGASTGGLPSQMDSNVSTSVVTTTAAAGDGAAGGSANANASTTTTSTNASSMYSQYIVGEWSECSSECGEGRRTRTVTCTFGAGACAGTAPVAEELCRASSECSDYWPILLWALLGTVLLLPCCALLAFKLRSCHGGAAGAAAEEDNACSSTQASAAAAATDVAALEAGFAKTDLSSPKQVAATAAAVIGSSQLVSSPVAAAAAVTKSPVVGQQLVQMVAAPSRVVRIIKSAPQTVGVSEQAVMHAVMPSNGSYPSTLTPVPQQLYAAAAQAGSPIHATGMTAALPAVQQTTRGPAWSRWLQTANGEAMASHQAAIISAI